MLQERINTNGRKYSVIAYDHDYKLVDDFNINCLCKCHKYEDKEYYFIKTISGKLYNPLSGLRSEYVQNHKMSMDTVKFIQVSLKCWNLYLNFLRTKDEAMFSKAVMEKENA